MCETKGPESGAFKSQPFWENLDRGGPCGLQSLPWQHEAEERLRLHGTESCPLQCCSPVNGACYPVVRLRVAQTEFKSPSLFRPLLASDIILVCLPPPLQDADNRVPTLSSCFNSIMRQAMCSAESLEYSKCSRKDALYGHR